jgi:uncharacterized protein
MTVDAGGPAPAGPRAHAGVFPAVLFDPHADKWTRPFWEAALDGRLVAPQCTSCGTFRLPPKPVCFACRGREIKWVDLPGTGTVYSYTVVRHPLAPELAEIVPYVVAVVELDGTQGAGARMTVNLVDCDASAVAVGDPVEIAWERVSETMAIPRFRPRTTPAASPQDGM